MSNYNIMVMVRNLILNERAFSMSLRLHKALAPDKKSHVIYVDNSTSQGKGEPSFE